MESSSPVNERYYEGDGNVSPHKISTPISSQYKIAHKFTLGEGSSEIFCLRFDAEDKYLAAGCGDGSIKIYNTLSGKIAYSLVNTHVASEKRMPCTSLRWRPSGSGTKTKNILLAVYSDGTVQHWHAGSGKCLHTIHSSDNQLNACDYNRDGSSFVTAGKDRVVRIYDETTKSITMEINKDNDSSRTNVGHSNRIFALKYVKDDFNLLCSGGWDNTVQIYDLRTGGVARCIFGPHLCGDSLDVSNGEVLTGSWRPKDQLQTFDLGTGELIQNVSWDGGLFKSRVPVSLYASQFSKLRADMYIAGGSGSNEVKIFDRATHTPFCTISDLNRACLSLDFSNQNSMFAAGCADGCLRLMNITKI